MSRYCSLHSPRYVNADAEFCRYVADASVFPSASGVNPQITVMAIADWIANGIAEELEVQAT